MIAYRPSMYTDFPAAPYSYLNDDDEDDFDRLNLLPPPPSYSESTSNTPVMVATTTNEKQQSSQQEQRTFVCRQYHPTSRQHNSLVTGVFLYFKQSLAKRRATRREKRPQDGKTNPFE